MDIPQLYQLYQTHPFVITDSRKIKKDCLFFALKGDRFDGNEFASEALEKGAAYAVVDDPSLRNDRFITVNDTLQTLQDLAHFHRKQMHIPIIGVTGSNGKTTTKELMFAVLNSHYRAYATKGNLNNHIGVPLSLLDMPKDTEVAVIEMGANHQGEIALLSEIAAPTHGLITNIGRAHLEGFGGPEGVKKGKGELYRYLEQHEGIAFVNLNEKHLEEMVGEKLRAIPYRKSESPSMEHAELEVQLRETDPFISIGFLDMKGEFHTCTSQLSGDYNFNNIMTAVAVGKYFKVPGKNICEAIAAYLPTNSRSQILKRDTNTFYLDAYNANPTSMAAALEHFIRIAAPAKIVIMGDMLELGEYSQSDHRKILDLMQGAELEKVILVGDEFKKVITEKDRVQWFPAVNDLKKWFNSQAFKHKTIFLKGSRSMKMEQLLN